MAIFQKTNDQQPQLQLEDASKILENVFKENQVEPNTIPLEVLTAYSNYRKERFSLQRLIIVIIMVLFLMLPLLFVPSTFTIQPNMAPDTTNPTFTLKVTSNMLVKRITAVIDGRNVPIYEQDSHVYSIEPAVNGKMKVTVTLMNNQTATEYVDVQHVDLDAPVILSNTYDDDYVYLYLSDVGSGVDYENIMAVNSAGETIKPVSYEESSGCVTFSYPKDTLNISIPDFAHNKLQLIISLK